MNTNRGMEIKTSLVITAYARCTIKERVLSSAKLGSWKLYEMKVKIIPMPIRVKAVGKPNMMATTTKESIKRPIWPLWIFPQGIRMIVAKTTKAMMEKPNKSSLRILLIPYLCQSWLWVHQRLLLQRLARVKATHLLWCKQHSVRSQQYLGLIKKLPQSGWWF